MKSVEEANTEVKRLFKERKFQEAIDFLTTKMGGQPEDLIALAYFRSEHYEKAAEHYENALKEAPNNEDLQEMLALSKVNAIAEVNVQVPDLHYFDRDTLLAKPIVPDGALPPKPAPPGPAGLMTNLRLALGNSFGAIVSVLMDSLTHLWGGIAGYRDRVWTNWYRRPITLGILTLAYMRDKLNANNLKDTYPSGSLTGFQPEGQTPPEGVSHYRTADGSWNNLSNPMEGAAGTRFPRNVEDEAIKPETGEQLMTPNPRKVSRTLLTRGEMKEVPFLNLLACSWIQFENHDWITHGEMDGRPGVKLHEIPLDEDDPARKKFWQSKIFVAKTQADPTRMPDKDKTPVTFINEVTHWWDGSQIYGSDQKTVDSLRSGVDGKIKLNEDDTLPLDEKGMEKTGFVRNWWVGLSMLHTVFSREHNAICDHLKKHYPDWDDSRLFNVARLINAAIMAKIHSVEWTPAVLPNPGLDQALNANWYGILTNLFQTGKHRKTLADINVRNPEMGGVVGNPINKHGAPYGLTEEFVEVYRLHSFLPELLKIRKHDQGEIEEEIPVAASRQAGSGKITKRVKMADLFYSFGNQHPGQLVLNNFPKFMQELGIPGNPLFDMGAIDILRARERGVPRYNEFRRQLGMNPIQTFEDLFNPKMEGSVGEEMVPKLKEVYGNDVEKLDLMVGTLAEEYRPTGFGFGETMFQIFILNATRRLQADRFYTDCYTAEYYTKEGLEWIDQTDLKTVLLRHYPELANTGLANIRNAFEPWDTGEKLDPSRHPLRAFNKQTKKNPWKGDAYQ
ncbi:MAG TPA: peroxidase family protein [Sunxiuqinia sp.]|nr:peroxidase family protein [Sunxiuqinia sp.]